MAWTCRSSARGPGSYREGSKNPLEQPSIGYSNKNFTHFKAVTGGIHINFVIYILLIIEWNKNSMGLQIFCLSPPQVLTVKVRIYWSRRWVETYGGSGEGTSLQLSESYCEGEQGTSFTCNTTGKGLFQHPTLFSIKWLTRFTLRSTYSFTSLLSPPFKILFSSTIRNLTSLSNTHWSVL